MDDFETWTVAIRNNATGETVEYVEEYGNPDDNVFIWEDGNYACDCNRSLFFWRAKGLSNDEVNERASDCGHEGFTVTAIVNARGHLIYSESETIDAPAERRSLT